MPIAVRGALANDDGSSAVELRHVPATMPRPASNGSDQRQLGFFLTRITLQ